MKILALDTSSRAASCAWWEDGALIGEFFANASLTHSQTILPMVDALLENTRRKVEDVDLFAVSAGPGSFTGLRIGVAAVKGMAVALDKPCAAVSTLWGLALNMRGVEGCVVPMMDARAGQVYTAAFLGEGGQLTRLCEDMAVPVQKLYEMLLPFAGKPILLVGDGAKVYQGYFEERGLHTMIAPETLLHQRAGSLCAAAEQIAAESGCVDAADLQPVYLRLPQAERERLQKEQEDGK